MRRLVLALLLTGVSIAAACAHMKDDHTVCPEYRDLRCLSKEECTMDQQRGCQICRCTPVTMEDKPRAPDRPEEPR